MFDRAGSWNLKGEAQYFSGLESRLQKYHKQNWREGDLKVHPQPRERYLAPSFLKKTATAEQLSELNALLEQLWSVNQQFVGEHLMEVGGYFALTGENLELEHAFTTWCDGYMGRRADPSRITPQVNNSPLYLAERLVDEWFAIFGKLHLDDNSVNEFFLQVAMCYTTWLLYDRLWKKDVYLVDETHVAVRETGDMVQMNQMRHRLEEGGWLHNRLAPLLSAVKSWASSVRTTELNRVPSDLLRKRIRGLAGDIHEMRPFLVRNFHPRKTLLELTSTCSLAWEWHIGVGVASFSIGKTPAEVLKYIETLCSMWSVRVGYDGLLFDKHMPWYTPADLPLLDGVKPLALNYLLLEYFHDLFFSFYEKIDFSRIRSHPSNRPAAYDHPSEADADDETVAVACHTLAESTAVTEHEDDRDSTCVRRIPVLRLQRVLRLFENRLGCEVGQGKGSEVNVYRPGGRIYTLGAHKRNREVHPLTVRRMLKVLDIPVKDFHAAVFG